MQTSNFKHLLKLNLFTPWFHNRVPTVAFYATGPSQFPKGIFGDASFSQPQQVQQSQQSTDNKVFVHLRGRKYVGGLEDEDQRALEYAAHVSNLRDKLHNLKTEGNSVNGNASVVYWGLGIVSQIRLKEQAYGDDAAALQRACSDIQEAINAGRSNLCNAARTETQCLDEEWGSVIDSIQRRPENIPFYPTIKRQAMGPEYEKTVSGADAEKGSNRPTKPGSAEKGKNKGGKPPQPEGKSGGTKAKTGKIAPSETVKKVKDQPTASDPKLENIQSDDKKTDVKETTSEKVTDPVKSE